MEFQFSDGCLFEKCINTQSNSNSDACGIRFQCVKPTSTGSPFCSTLIGQCTPADSAPRDAQAQTATNQCATYELSLSITDNEWFWHREGQVHQFAATPVVPASPSHRFAFHCFQDLAQAAPFTTKASLSIDVR